MVSFGCYVFYIYLQGSLLLCKLTGGLRSPYKHVQCKYHYGNCVDK